MSHINEKLGLKPAGNSEAGLRLALAKLSRYRMYIEKGHAPPLAGVEGQDTDTEVADGLWVKAADVEELLK